MLLMRVHRIHSSSPLDISYFLANLVRLPRIVRDFLDLFVFCSTPCDVRRDFLFSDEARFVEVCLRIFILVKLWSNFFSSFLKARLEFDFFISFLLSHPADQLFFDLGYRTFFDFVSPFFFQISG